MDTRRAVYYQLLSFARDIDRFTYRHVVVTRTDNSAAPGISLGLEGTCTRARNLLENHDGGEEAGTFIAT